MNRRHTILYSVILASIFAAMTTVITFLVKIPIPGGAGYIHLGDAVIYISASVLPLPFAIASAGIGGALADGLGGYTAYIIPTLIIKALSVPCFARKENKLLCKKNIVAVIIASMITIVGYFVADTIIMYFSMSVTQIKYSMISALANVPWNSIQAVSSAIVFIILAVSLDKIQIKSKVFGGRK